MYVAFTPSCACRQPFASAGVKAKSLVEMQQADAAEVEKLLQRQQAAQAQVRSGPVEDARHCTAAAVPGIQGVSQGPVMPGRCTQVR